MDAAQYEAKLAARRQRNQRWAVNGLLLLALVGVLVFIGRALYVGQQVLESRRIIQESVRRTEEILSRPVDKPMPWYIECRAEGVVLQPDGIAIKNEELRLPGNRLAGYLEALARKEAKTEEKQAILYLVHRNSRESFLRAVSAVEAHCPKLKISKEPIPMGTETSFQDSDGQPSPPQWEPLLKKSQPDRTRVEASD